MTLDQIIVGNTNIIQQYIGSTLFRDFTTTAKTLKDFSFPVNFTIKEGFYNRANYIKWFVSDAVSLTAENAFKLGHVYSSATAAPDWSDSDAARNFAIQNNLDVHGHALIWGDDGSTPQFVLDMETGPNPAATVKAFMIKTITERVTRYKDVIKSWDVVNEALDWDGTTRSSIFFRLLGEDMFEIAFKAAYDADPKCKLFYNDYGIEYGNSDKLNRIISIRDRLKAKGIPIHGVGLQFHVSLGLDIDVARNRLRRLSDAGFLVHISELDTTTGKPYTAEIAERLAKFYYNVFLAYQVAVAPKNMWGITMWSVGDLENYMNRAGVDSNGWLPHYPMLIDQNYNPKLAYFRVLTILDLPTTVPLIYQDFTAGDLIPDLIGSQTGGTSPAIWKLGGKDPNATIQVDLYGIKARQTSLNVYNYPLLTSPTKNFAFSAEASTVFDGTKERVMYMVFRFIDDNNYFGVKALRNTATGEDYWALVKRQTGSSVDVVVLETDIKPQWGDEPKVLVKDNNIIFYVNDQLIGSTIDSDFNTSLLFGFKMRGFDDKFSAWHNIKLNAL